MSESQARVPRQAGRAPQRKDGAARPRAWAQRRGAACAGALLVAAALLAATGQARAQTCAGTPRWSELDPAGFESGDRVVHRGQLFECNPFPTGGWCKLKGYEPGVEPGTSAWTLLGTCLPMELGPVRGERRERPQMPAASGACDGAGPWERGRRYDAGDRALSARGAAYRCAVSGGRCDDTAPGGDDATWQSLGDCSGSAARARVLDAPDLRIVGTPTSDGASCSGEQARWTVRVSNASLVPSRGVLRVFQTSGAPGDAGVLRGELPLPRNLSLEPRALRLQPELRFGRVFGATRAPWIRMVVVSDSDDADPSNNAAPLVQLRLCER